ncbi:MAG: hypothetical protein ACHQIM_20140, partial [Sphingobacteriales bacterium]
MKAKALPLFVLMTAKLMTFASGDSTAIALVANAAGTPSNSRINVAKQNAKQFGENFVDIFLDRKVHKKFRDTTQMPDPFSQFDLTWMNGNDRRHSALLDSKYVTGIFLCDVNYTTSLAHPVDNTVVGSTALGRNDEVEVTLCALGAEIHANNVRGKLL